MSDNTELLGENNESEYHEPKLMFHKTEMYSRWICDGQEYADFTEKAPPDTSYKWNEDLNNWGKINPIEPDKEVMGDNNG